MRHTALLTLAIAIAAALPLATQAQATRSAGEDRGTDQPARAIGIGPAVTGSFTHATPKGFDGTPYVLYRLRGAPGQRVRIDMTSAAFDAYLMAGARNPGLGCDSDAGCRTNDDGGGGHNARLTATIPGSGELFISANAVEQDAHGAYTLRLQSLAALPAPTITALATGSTVNGRLSQSGAQDEDGKPYALYSVQGTPGERLVASMDSDDFDTLLKVGRYQNGSFDSTKSDDDSGAKMNARLRFTLDDSGRTTLMATAAGSDASGAYSLKLVRTPPPAALNVKTVEIGQAVRGELGEMSWQADDDHFADVYTIRGNPGERITVMLDSSDFDPVLRWGVMDGQTFVKDVENDDAEGAGTNSRLTITLDNTGKGRLMVTSVEDSGTGSYTLSLVRPVAR